MVVVVAATGEDVPHVVGVVGVRGAEPPVGGAAVELRDSLVVSRATGSVEEVIQSVAVVREILVIAAVPAEFLAGQQENLAAQAVRSRAVSAAGAAVLAIRDLYLLDGVSDVGVIAIDPCVVQVRVDVRGFVFVYVSAVPYPVFGDVLSQQPCAIARIVIHRRGFSLMHDNIIYRTSILVQFDNTAD